MLNVLMEVYLTYVFYTALNSSIQSFSIPIFEYSTTNAMCSLSRIQLEMRPTKLTRRGFVGGIGLLAGTAATGTVVARRRRKGQNDDSSGSLETLSDAERAGIRYMREEEKLARDVYLTFYEKWGLTIFDGIANSEQRHTDAIKNLIDKYGLGDPYRDAIGSFTNDELQSLYDSLVARGLESPTEALMVGGLIEETDIIDIQEFIDQTDNDDIITVYSNLMESSKNHLSAFVDVLAKRGIDYEPQVLSQETYERIIA